MTSLLTSVEASVGQPTLEPGNPAPLPSVDFSRDGNLGFDPVSMRHFMHSWMPMGIRVVINLPYIGDDDTYLFAIRHSPIIPHLAWRRARAVKYWRDNFPVRAGRTGNTGISITQHSMPPVCSLLAQCYRAWKGSIQYELRCVSNFAAQGAIVVGQRRNVFYSFSNSFDPTIGGFLPGFSAPNTNNQIAFMHNAYSYSDVSMFRHIQTTSPYTRIPPWFDQFSYESACFSNVTGIENRYPTDPALWRALQWGHDEVVFSLKGAIAASDTSNQLMFELHMRLCEDFEFDQPVPPPPWLLDTYVLATGVNNPRRIITIPSTAWRFSGNNTIVAATTAISAEASVIVSPPSSQPATEDDSDGDFFPSRSVQTEPVYDQIPAPTPRQKFDAARKNFR